MADRMRPASLVFPGSCRFIVFESTSRVEVNQAMNDKNQNDSRDNTTYAVSPVVRDLCRTVRALSHEQRLAILVHLSHKECSVGELEKKLDLPQPAVSQQLARLRSEGLVTTRREGRTIYYCAHRQRLTDFLARLNGVLV